MLYNIPLVLGYLLLSAILVVLLYKTHYRWVGLLLASLEFYYIVVQKSILILLFLSLVVFFGGKAIEKKTISRYTYRLLLLLALLPLVLYKFHIVNDNSIRAWITAFLNSPYGDVAYFAGLSFFTLNGVGYLVDIKRGYTKAEKNYGVVLLYLCYFPHVLSGPLNRSKHLIQQFKTSVHFDSRNFSLAFRLILWGIFKKYVLANNLEAYTNSILDSPTPPHGMSYLYVGLLYFLEIYCDFSSYVDISLGISQFFGIRMESNFNNRVYASTSRKQFWDGWNITLNKWFRDYFFFPIARNVVAKWQLDACVLITFLLIGIWHGVTTQFVLWGLLNGLWVISERRIGERIQFIPRQIKPFTGLIYHLTFASILALIFRSPRLNETFSALADFSLTDVSIPAFPKYILVAFIYMDIVYRKSKNNRIDEYIGEQKPQVRWLLYIATATFILLSEADATNYHYFQF